MKLSLSRLALLSLFPSVAVFAQATTAPATMPAPAGDAAFPPPPPAATMPATTAPSLPAAVTLPNPADAKSPIEAARGYASLFKAGTPRAAASLYLDFDAFATRCFGDDYKKATPVEQLEIRELATLIVYHDYLNPQVPMVLATLSYENFREIIGPMADSTDVEYDLIGEQGRGKQKLTFQQINGTWRITDLWMGPNSLSLGINRGWTQMKAQVNLLTFCRILAIPPQMRQGGPGQGPGPGPDDHEGPPQGPGQGPAHGPARPPAGPALAGPGMP